MTSLPPVSETLVLLLFTITAYFVLPDHRILVWSKRKPRTKIVAGEIAKCLYALSVLLYAVSSVLLVSSDYSIAVRVFVGITFSGAMMLINLSAHNTLYVLAVFVELVGKLRVVRLLPMKSPPTALIRFVKSKYRVSSRVMLLYLIVILSLMSDVLYEVGALWVFTYFAVIYGIVFTILSAVSVIRWLDDIESLSAWIVSARLFILEFIGVAKEKLGGIRLKGGAEEKASAVLINADKWKGKVVKWIAGSAGYMQIILSVRAILLAPFVCLYLVTVLHNVYNAIPQKNADNQVEDRRDGIELAVFYSFIGERVELPFSSVYQRHEIAIRTIVVLNGWLMYAIVIVLLFEVIRVLNDKYKEIGGQLLEGMEASRSFLSSLLGQSSGSDAESNDKGRDRENDKAI